MIGAKIKVTVLMAVYNGEFYLRESIDSILNQTFKDFEFLIIDDCSTDLSRDVIRPYCDPRIRFIVNSKNLGLIKTLNYGLELARGEYIARQDQDDISHPTRLEKQVAYLNSNPDVVLLGTRVNSIDQDGRRSEPFGCATVSSEHAIRWQSMFDNPFVHPSVMMRSDIVHNVGGYDEHFAECEDFDLFSRLLNNSKATNLKEALLDYRYHHASMDANRTKENNLLIGEILRRSFKTYLKIEPSEKWISLWLSINNTHNIKSLPNFEELSPYITSIYKKFVSSYPDAAKNKEIKYHITRMLFRISYNLILMNRRGSLYYFYLFLKRDVFLAFRFLPRFLTAFTLGRNKTLLSCKLRAFSRKLKASICVLKNKVFYENASGK